MNWKGKKMSELQEGADPFGRRFRCSRCQGGATKKLPLHCKVVAGEIQINCSNDDCNCPCRTHYACRSCGHLHPYGKDCDVRKVELSPVTPEMQKAIEMVNDFAKEQREKAAKTFIKEET